MSLRERRESKAILMVVRGECHHEANNTAVRKQTKQEVQTMKKGRMRERKTMRESKLTMRERKTRDSKMGERESRERTGVPRWSCPS